jgi:hypothetical protein
VSRIVILIAAENAARGGRLASLAREVGIEHVIHVDSLIAALDWLRHETADLLLCGERANDPRGVAVLDDIRRASPATRVLWIPDDKTPEPRDPDAPPVSNPLTSRAMLAAFLHDVVAPRPGFSCAVPALSLPDILQLYHQRRRSVSVLISGSAAGRLRLEDGELVHAESGSSFGAAALCRLLESTPRLVRAELSPFDGRQTLYEPFHRVLLDAMNQIERRREPTRGKNGGGENEGGANEGGESGSDESAGGEDDGGANGGGEDDGGASGGGEDDGGASGSDENDARESGSDENDARESRSDENDARESGSDESAGGADDGGESGGGEGELDRRLLSAPAPEVPMALPDASSFAPDRWWLLRRRPLVVAAVLATTMLVCALAGSPTARDLRAANPSHAPTVHDLSVSVERLQVATPADAIRTAPSASVAQQSPPSPLAADAGPDPAKVPSALSPTLAPARPSPPP